MLYIMFYFQKTRFFVFHDHSNSLSILQARVRVPFNRQCIHWPSV